MPEPPEAAPFRFIYPVPVRFRDLDAMGHAHHSLALIYIEEARAAYWRDVLGRNELDEIDYVLGQVSVRFLKRITFPGTLRVGVRVSRLGNSSFTMQYEIRGQSGEQLASAETVQVMYDYAADRPKPIPAEVRNSISEFERLASSGGAIAG
ncbi:MAG: acyl-CoA thioesterase [Pseudomonas sp.]